VFFRFAGPLHGIKDQGGGGKRKPALGVYVLGGGPGELGTQFENGKADFGRILRISAMGGVGGTGWAIVFGPGTRGQDLKDFADQRNGRDGKKKTRASVRAPGFKCRFRKAVLAGGYPACFSYFSGCGRYFYPLTGARLYPPGGGQGCYGPNSERMGSFQTFWGKNGWESPSQPGVSGPGRAGGGIRLAG